MSHFYGEMWGTGSSKSSRTGSKSTGLRAHVRGWSEAKTVQAIHDAETEGEI